MNDIHVFQVSGQPGSQSDKFALSLVKIISSNQISTIYDRTKLLNDIEMYKKYNGMIPITLTDDNTDGYCIFPHVADKILAERQNQTNLEEL